MIFSQYEVIEDSAEPLRGTFVNCWIERATLEAAEMTAKEMMEANDWQIIEGLEAQQLTGDNFDLGDNAERYYKQAEIDSEVLRFNTYPIQES